VKFQWLTTTDSLPPPANLKVTHRKGGYVEKTLKEITSFFLNWLFSEEIISRRGLLQSIDPRVKVLTLGLFIVAVSLYKTIFLLLGVYLFTLFLAYFSRISLRFFLVRVWLFIPLFSGIIAVPAIFNVFVPGEPIVNLFTFKSEVILGPLKIPETISITRQGLLTASLFVMRVATSVSLMVLLTLTTRWCHILKALRVFRVPQFFTFILAMTYRYIHLLMRQIEDIHFARKSRTIGKEKRGSGRKWAVSQIKFVLKSSLNMGEHVYSAMVSRGFTHELKVIENFNLRRIDYAWIIFSVFIIAVTLVLNWL